MIDPKRVRHLGLDVGTTNTSLCYTRFDRGAGRFDEPMAVKLGRHPFLPSALLLDERGERLAAGEDVFHHPAYLEHPERVREEFKLRLGGGGADGAEAEQCVRLLLEDVRGRAGDVLPPDEPADGVVTNVGVPAEWTRSQPARVEAMLRAVRAAGLPHVEATPEPVAAMYLHAHRGDIAFEDRTQSWLVIDIGGGTTDLAVVDTQPNGARPAIRHTFGQTFGGRDFDRLLLQKLVLERHWPGEHAPTPIERLKLIQFVRDFKQRFSDHLGRGQDRYSQRAPVKGVRNPVELTRQAFESAEMGAPLINEFAGMLARAFRQSDRSLRDIDRVILTGGSARWYFVREMADSYFGRSVCLVSPHPELTISQGLALARTGFEMPRRAPAPAEAAAGPTSAPEALETTARAKLDALPLASISDQPLDLRRCHDEAEGCVKRWAATAGGVGTVLGFIPGISQIPLTGIEAKMVMDVARAYGYRLEERQLMTVVVGLLAGGTAAKIAVSEMLTFVPGVGWLLKGGVAITAAYGFGQIAIQYFEKRRRAEQGEYT